MQRRILVLCACRKVNWEALGVLVIVLGWNGYKREKMLSWMESPENVQAQEKKLGTDLTDMRLSNHYGEI